jgi:hypothetical protein
MSFGSWPTASCWRAIHILSGGLLMKIVGWAVLCAATVTAVSACETTERRDLGKTSGALVSDEAHNGEAGLFFLPPMVSSPTLTGTFASNLAPVVVITELDATTSQPTARGVVATFTMTTGPGSETVRLEASDYIVNWHTKDFALDTSRRYRIEVRVGAKSTGFADVQPVATGKQLKNVDTSEFIALLDDSTLPIKFFLNGCAPVVCAASDSCHVAGHCNPTTAACTNPSAADGAVCTGGTCMAGACTPSSCSSLSFANVGSYFVPDGSLPIELKLGDLNGDGRVDVAVASYFGGLASFLANPDGTFLYKGQYSHSGGGVNSIDLADFDGDGNLDGLLAQYTANSVAILRGLGDGSFGVATTIATGGNTQLASAADVNGDGRPDVLAANIEGTVSVLLQNADHTFATPVLYAVGTEAFERPHQIAAKDLNGDGHADLEIANGPTFAVLLGDGTGSFGAISKYPTIAGDSTGLVMADFDGNGHVDAALASRANGIVGIFFGNADGTFGPVTNYTVGAGAAGITAGDLNGDGRLDVATANQSSNDVTILVNQGGGAFTVVSPFTPADTGDVTDGIGLTDVDGDGKQDILVTDEHLNSLRVFRNTCH